MKKKSYAKINLALNVTNKTKPSWMHDLDMINLTLSLYDEVGLKIIKNKNNQINITCNNPSVPTDESNFVYKVVKQYQKVFKKDFSCNIDIKKNIPLESGLGGGSSNATTVLELLDMYFETNMTDKQKVSLLEKISSDSAYFVYSPYIARVKGTGSNVNIISSHLNYKVALIKPKSGCSTKEVYGSLDYPKLVHPNINKVIEAIENNDFELLKKHCFNSLQDSAMKLNDDIKETIQRLECCGFEIVLLTGSGSTCFAISNKNLAYTRLKELFAKEKYELVGIYNIKNGIKLL